MKILTKILKQHRPIFQGAVLSCLMWANLSPAASYFGTSAQTLQAVSDKSNAHTTQLKYVSSAQHKKINQHLYLQLKNIF